MDRSHQWQPQRAAGVQAWLRKEASKAAGKKGTLMMKEDEGRQRTVFSVRRELTSDSSSKTSHDNQRVCV